MTRKPTGRRPKKQTRRTRTRLVPQIVEVIWEDSYTTDGWEAHRRGGPETAECRSVGYLLSRDMKHIVLAGSWSDTEVMSKTTIPMGVVRAVVKLRK
jgi:hypothetical protein